MGVGVLIGIWIARYLGPEQFGLYSYAIAFVALLSVLSTLGLEQVVVRNLVRDEARKDETLGTAFVLRLLGGIITLLSAGGAIWLLQPGSELTQWLVVIIAAGAIFQAFDIVDYWFQSRVQSKYTVYARDAAFLLAAIVKVGLILIQAPLIAFAWAILAETFLSAVGLFVAYRLSGERFSAWRADLKGGRALLAESWPLILSAFSVVIYMKIDQVMLNLMVGTEAVGIFSAATRISEAWYFIPTVIVSSVFPSIIQAKRFGERLYYERLQKLFSLMIGVAFVIAIPMTFLSKTIVVLLFGEPFAGAGSILAIHIWAAVFVFVGVAQSSWYVTEGFTKVLLRRTAASAVLNVVLNLILIPSYGGIGAAVATVISYAYSAYLGNLIDTKTRHIFYLQTKALFFLRSLRA